MMINEFWSKILKAAIDFHKKLNFEFKEKKELTDLEDLSEREQVMLRHRIVTGRTLPSAVDSPDSESPAKSSRSS